jgi:hypothetical protein
MLLSQDSRRRQSRKKAFHGADTWDFSSLIRAETNGNQALIDAKKLSVFGWVPGLNHGNWAIAANPF